ncbi:hypothetical protein HG15A2_01920 [Adhaeretor mobilis]|uniref:PEP-CTERM protein-sorting domain-containing protein n=2 Tax=Adhaeretor mobilis TaxID=1930276 RepID=A0A517MPX1_9BACT|nr:hypothetical protein HG15A2_01920 [Adhaeretor mobilis]
MVSIALNLAFVSDAQATVMINNGGLNNISTPSEDLDVSNGAGATSTVLNIMDGADIGVNGDGRSVGLSEQSVLNFSGGIAQGGITMTGNSIANLTGSSDISGDISADGNSELQINSNASVGGEVFIEGNATASFLGGEVEVFGIGGAATATINGGSINDDLVAEGDAIVTVHDVFVNDDVDAGDSGVVHLMGGLFDEDVTAAGNSTINISGGDYVRIFSDGAALTAEQGTINVTGGIFGETGVDDGGLALATLGGTLNFDGAEIAGTTEDMAPTAAFSAALNGKVNLSNVDFGNLVVETSTNGTVNLGEITAKDISATVFGGGELNILSGEADSLSIFAELAGEINLRGGDFGDSLVTLESESILTVFGSDLTFNGTPVEDLNAVLGAGAFDEATGKLGTIAGDLAGVLADGSAFSLSFSRSFIPPTASQVFLVQVPEPSTTVLLSCLLMGLAMKKRSVRSMC